MNTPETNCWGIEYTPSGVTAAHNLYAVTGPQGVKPHPTAPMIIVCTPSRGTVPVELLMAWKRISIPINTVTGFIYSRGELSTIAREKMTFDAIKLGAKYIYYADDDVLPPVNVLYKMLTEMEKDPTIGLLTGVYTTKVDPPHPHIYKRAGEGHYWGFSMNPYDPPEDIWGCGAGAMLVRVEAILKCKKPYWAEKVSPDPENSHDVTGHDLHFCQKIKEAGYRVCVDGSIICGHVSGNSIYSIPSNSPPMRRLRQNANTAEYWNRVWGVECWGNERTYAELYNLICDEVAPESTVLDIGAGIGVLLQWLINRKRVRAHAYEISDAAVDFLNGRFIPAELKSAQDIELSDLEHFKYIICTEVLEHLEDDEMRHVLNVMGASKSTCIISVPQGVINAPEGEHIRVFDVTSFEKLLKSIFRFVRISVVQNRILAVCRNDGLLVQRSADA